MSPSATGDENTFLGSKRSLSLLNVPSLQQNTCCGLIYAFLHITHAHFTKPKWHRLLRWPRELNALQLPQIDNTHAANAHNTSKKKRNALQIEKNTCKLRKHSRQFDNTHAANAHNTTTKRNALQIEKKHLQIKKTLSSIWQCTRCKCPQHNQKRNALQIKCIWLCCEHLQRVSLFVCVVSICTICCQNDENVFLICWCFFYLHVFSEVAACWALLATVG